MLLRIEKINGLLATVPPSRAVNAQPGSVARARITVQNTQLTLEQLKVEEDFSRHLSKLLWTVLLSRDPLRLDGSKSSIFRAIRTATGLPAGRSRGTCPRLCDPSRGRPFFAKEKTEA